VGSSAFQKEENGSEKSDDEEVIDPSK